MVFTLRIKDIFMEALNFRIGLVILTKSSRIKSNQIKSNLAITELHENSPLKYLGEQQQMKPTGLDDELTESRLN